MTYRTGDTYRYCKGLSNGRLLYEDAKIDTVSPPSGERPGKLYLDNGKVIELVGAPVPSAQARRP